jgi:hypothetical protein
MAWPSRNVIPDVILLGQFFMNAVLKSPSVVFESVYVDHTLDRHLRVEAQVLTHTRHGIRKGRAGELATVKFI